VAGMKSTGTIHMEAIDSEHVNGTSQMDAAGGRNNMNVKIRRAATREHRKCALSGSFTAHWLGSDCGAMKKSWPARQAPTRGCYSVRSACITSTRAARAAGIAAASRRQTPGPRPLQPGTARWAGSRPLPGRASFRHACSTRAP
jgi:hypothetical protein